MKRLELVGFKACPRCHRAVAYLKTDEKDQTLAIALDASKARELSRNYEEPGREKFLTDFFLQSLSNSSCVPRQVVLDCSEEGLLSARVDMTTAVFSCSPQDGIALAVAAGIPLYAVERIFEHRHLFHPSDTESESTDLVQPKLKPTLH